LLPFALLVGSVVVRRVAARQSGQSRDIHQ
jgi:hypothetical protein